MINIYLLFHTLVEGFAIIAASLIYVLGSRTFRLSKDYVLLFIGQAFLFVNILDFWHLVTYEGMNVIPGVGANNATQFWIASRFILASSLCAAPYMAKLKPRPRVILIGYSILTLAVLVSIFYYPIFPTCYLKQSGLTFFKKTSETVIIALLFMSILLFKRFKTDINTSVYQTVTKAVAFTIISELCFTLYFSVYDLFNFLGHVFKVIAYLFVYKGIFIRGIDDPFNTVFEKLRASSYLDYLTGLYNRHGFFETAKQTLIRAENPCCPLLLDLDRFKQINDTYGHQVGDEVLIKFGALLRAQLTLPDLACRLGGDEFLVLTYGGQEAVPSIKKAIRDALQNWCLTDPRIAGLGVSIGASCWEPGEHININELLSTADQAMYLEKNAKKGTRNNE